MKNLFLFLFILASFGFAQAQETIDVKQYSNHENGLALEGYDAVSYFTGKPVKGKSTFSITHQGIRYQFSNKKNLDVFKNNPEMYIPVYGGWCAYAMADSGSLVTVDPETYKIVDGKLYLFYNQYFNNTLKKWNRKESEYLKLAEHNWKKYLKSLGNE